METSLSTLSHMIVEKMASVLEGILVKLARYDETKLLSSLLSLTVSSHVLSRPLAPSRPLASSRPPDFTTRPSCRNPWTSAASHTWSSCEATSSRCANELPTSCTRCRCSRYAPSDLSSLSSLSALSALPALSTLTPPTPRPLSPHAALSVLTSPSFQAWYAKQIRVIYDWLHERADLALHSYQLTCISTIIKVSPLCSPHAL